MSRARVLVLAPLLAALSLTGCGSDKRGDTQPVVAANYQGAVLSKPLALPKTQLTATDGTRFDFATADPGTLRLVFFGYTHCEDTCPTTMADIAAALRKVPVEMRERTRVVFVTSDPKRDTLPVMRKWLDRFDKTFVGVTGTDAQIAAVAKAMGVPLLPEEKLPSGGYDIPHGAQVIPYTPDDKAHLIWLGGTQVKQFRSDIVKLLSDPAYGGPQ